MRKPVSPTEWDAASARDRRIGKVPSVRPTEEEYAAALAAYEIEQAPIRARSARITALEALGGKYWESDDGRIRRVYFKDGSFEAV